VIGEDAVTIRDGSGEADGISRWARSSENRCFVCGPANPIGLHLDFRLDGELCRGEFTPSEHHVGYDGVVHGGILYSALDDVLANWLFLRGERAVTARCEVRYREPVGVGTALLLEGRLRRRRGPLAILEGRVLRAEDGVMVAECEASFMVVGPRAADPGGSLDLRREAGEAR
jgi:acyl-coenzyme A thioesterase PaaI-like protein